MTPYARTVIKQVAASRGIDPRDIIRPNRTKKVFRARIEVAKLLDARGYSTPRIGAILKHDHTTIVFYLGRGKKRPGPEKPPKIKAAKIPARPRWHKPRIQHLKCKGCFRCKTVGERMHHRGYLKPYAGADMTEYQWKEIEIRAC